MPARLPWAMWLLTALLFACSSGDGSGTEPPTPGPAIDAAACTPSPESSVPPGDYSEILTEGVLYLIGADVPTADQARVLAGATAARDFLIGEGLAPPELVCIDVRVTDSGLAGSGNVKGTHAIVYTAPQGLTAPRAWHLSMVTAHEYAHAWQYHASADSPPGGASWLVEGAAQYVALRAVGESGIASEAEVEALMKRQSGPLVPDLRDLEEAQEFHIVNAPYGLACAAVELLVQRNGVASLGAYWQSLAGGAAWQPAFELAFGLTPQQFYEVFYAAAP